MLLLASGVEHFCEHDGGEKESENRGEGGRRVQIEGRVGGECK
jgi:hypothetical protein